MTRMNTDWSVLSYGLPDRPSPDSISSNCASESHNPGRAVADGEPLQMMESKERKRWLCWDSMCRKLGFQLLLLTFKVPCLYLCYAFWFPMFEFPVGMDLACGWLFFSVQFDIRWFTYRCGVLFLVEQGMESKFDNVFGWHVNWKQCQWI